MPHFRRSLVLVVVAVVVVAGLWMFGAKLVAGATAALKAAPVCTAAAPVVVGTISVPAGPVAGFCQSELVNAAHIINAARAQGIGTHTQAIGVMTAIGESGLRNLNYGDVAGPDSRGLFQQRANGAWGSLTDRMTPYIAATSFFTALVNEPGWKSLSPAEAAHKVQVNDDPEFYGRYWDQAVAVVGALNK